MSGKKRPSATKRSPRPAKRKPRASRAAKAGIASARKKGKGSAPPAAATRFQAIIETSTDLICCYLPDGRLTYVNEAYARFFGKPARELVGRTFQPLIPVEDRPMIDRMLAALQAQRLPYSHEHRVIRADGAIRWTQWRNSAIADGAGRLLEYQALGQDITERKRAEEALRESEARFRSAFEETAVGMVLLDATGRFLRANPAFCSLVGYAEDELHSKTFLELTHPEDLEKNLPTVKRLMAGEIESFFVEKRYLHKRGHHVWVHASVASVRDAQGRPLNFIAQSQHITERKQVEAALKASEERLRQAVRAGNIGIFDHDHLSDTIYWSPEQRRIYAWGAEESVTLPKYLQHVHAEDRERIAAALRRAHDPAGDGAFDVEHRIVDRHGTIRWLLTRSRTYFEGEGPARRKVRTIGAVADITERKRAEESLRQSLERFDLAVQGAHDGLWDAVAVSDDYFNPANPVYYSPRMKEIMGVEGDATPDTISTWAALVHPDDRERVFAALAAHITRHVPYDIEYRIIKKTGECRWVAAKGQALWDEAGRPLRMAGSFRDITEHRQLEDDLRQAQKMEAVGRLAGGIAHDFNNLLTVIGGCSDRLLRRMDPQDPLSRYVRDIKSSSDRAAALTHQLLAFSRRQVLEPKILSLNDSLLHIEPILRRLIGEHIELALALSPDLGPVKADPGQIAQVLLNLALNARDAMPNGGRLTIATTNATVDQGDAGKPPGLPPGAYAQLIVADTGQGMDRSTLSHLFEPFFTTKEVGKGTGLGLATAYGIVAQSGGTIWASSEPGQGATFTVCLPQVAQEIVRALEPSPPSGTTPRSTRGSETILLAEDEDTVRTLTRELLEEEGYRLLEARNGVEALALAEQHHGPIHLLLTDVVMPLMGGLALADRLTSDRPGLKVVYMSGHTQDPQLQQGLLEAQAAFLPKPLLPEMLLHKIRDVLDASP